MLRYAGSRCKLCNGLFEARSHQTQTASFLLCAVYSVAMVFNTVFIAILNYFGIAVTANSKCSLLLADVPRRMPLKRLRFVCFVAAQWAPPLERSVSILTACLFCKNV
jgi:hypothetical protein